MFPPHLLDLARKTLDEARAKGLLVATAESCTGGLIAGVLTEIPGSSDVLERGFVTYSNRAKVELLGVPQAVLDAHGAVSAETARAMAQGAHERAPVHLAVAVTGVAGPGGGTPDKPVGLVHFATVRGAPGTAPLVNAEPRRFGEQTSRTQIRLLTVREALTMLRREIGAMTDVLR